ncbi:hypothetical protein AB832_07650 [Flavobacteriaceae bacterium (ex Bugula neritina AB1)]|nr:hypothetical protein AB832_07650 [Flavobacteriaceae bacterium (ex Bugula neritina AB1)]
MTIENIHTQMLANADMRRHFDNMMTEYSQTWYDISLLADVRPMTSPGTSMRVGHMGDVFAVNSNYADPSSTLRRIETYEDDIQLVEREVPYFYPWKDFYRTGFNYGANLVSAMGKAFGKDKVQTIINTFQSEVNLSAKTSARLTVLDSDLGSGTPGTDTGLNKDKITAAKVALDGSDMDCDNRYLIGSNAVLQSFLTENLEFRSKDFLGAETLTRSTLPELYAGFKFYSVPSIIKSNMGNTLRENLGFTPTPQGGKKSLHYVFAVNKEALAYVIRDLEPFDMWEEKMHMGTYHRKPYATGSRIIRTEGVVVIPCVIDDYPSTKKEYQSVV